MKRPDPMDFAFAALIVVVGVAPLLAAPGWVGYGAKGDYTCGCGQYYLAFSDSAYGGNRPYVFALYQGSQVDMIQMSDSQSTVNGLDLYSNFSMTRQVSGGSLVVDYSSPTLNFTKQVSVADGVVRVSYAFGRNVTATLTFWRWYYATIGPFNRPVTRSLAVNGSIPFSAFGKGVLLNGTLSASPEPDTAVISGVPGLGLNKLALTFQGDRIDLMIALAGSKAPAGVGALEVASTNEALPIIGVVMASAYLVARSWVRGRK